MMYRMQAQLLGLERSGCRFRNAIDEVVWTLTTVPRNSENCDMLSDNICNVN